MADKLIIPKGLSDDDSYAKTLKVSAPLHARVKALANATNQPFHKVSCMLVRFALDHVEIQE